MKKHLHRTEIRSLSKEADLEKAKILLQKVVLLVLYLSFQDRRTQQLR